jgi:hypothetical protein
LLLPFGPFAGAQESPKLPWNPFEKAEVGDWAVYEKQMKMGEQASPQEHLELIPQADFELVEIRDAGDGHVVVARQSVLDTVPTAGHQAQTVSTKPGATLDEIFGDAPPDAPKPTDLKVTDEKHGAGGRTFDCKCLSFELNAGKEGTVKARQWLSRDVRAGSVVEMEMCVAGAP